MRDLESGCDVKISVTCFISYINNFIIFKFLGLEYGKINTKIESLAFFHQRWDQWRRQPQKSGGSEQCFCAGKQ